MNSISGYFCLYSFKAKTIYRDPEIENWLGWLECQRSKEEVCSIRMCRQKEGLAVPSNCIQDNIGCFKLGKEHII